MKSKAYLQLINLLNQQHFCLVCLQQSNPSTLQSTPLRQDSTAHRGQAHQGSADGTEVFLDLVYVSSPSSSSLQAAWPECRNSALSLANQHSL